MIYADLPAGATIFVDASVFIHHFEPNTRFGPAVTEFLERVGQEYTEPGAKCAPIIQIAAAILGGQGGLTPAQRFSFAANAREVADTQ